MVGRGEILERMTTVAARQGPLEALWQGGGVHSVHDVPVLLCPPHPALGGSMDSPVLADLVWMLGRRRHPTLRFNYGGVGASHGVCDVPELPATQPVDLSALVDDAAAALLHLLHSTGAERCYVVGLSVGALVAAQLAAHEAVEKLALIAPPIDVGVIDPLRLTESGVQWRCYVGGDDVFSPAHRLQIPGLVVIPHANHTFSRGLQALCREVSDDLTPALAADE